MSLPAVIRRRIKTWCVIVRITAPLLSYLSNLTPVQSCVKLTPSAYKWVHVCSVIVQLFMLYCVSRSLSASSLALLLSVSIQALDQEACFARALVAFQLASVSSPCVTPCRTLHITTQVTWHTHLTLRDRSLKPICTVVYFAHRDHQLFTHSLREGSVELTRQEKSDEISCNGKVRICLLLSILNKGVGGWKPSS